MAYLRSSGQMRDFDFIVSHVDDLDFGCQITGNEVVPRWRRRTVTPAP